MPFIKPRDTYSRVNFLASENFQSFTTLVAATGVVANAQGKKIVPAGTIYPANGATALGVLLHDVDVTYGDQPGALIVEGYILKDRLPTAPAEAAVTALKEIKFR